MERSVLQPEGRGAEGKELEGSMGCGVAPHKAG